MVTRIKIVAVCVSQRHYGFPGSIPFVNQVNPTPAPPRRTVARVAFVSHERNLGVQKARSEYPNLTHILMLDAWYLENYANENEWDRFIDAYQNPGTILGASTYQMHDTRLFASPVTYFVEIATALEAADSTMNVEGKTGRVRVQAVGSIYIFPIEAWEKNPYHARDDYFLPEHVDLCRESGLPVYLSFDHRFYKNPIQYSSGKKLRIAIGATWRRMIGV